MGAGISYGSQVVGNLQHGQSLGAALTRVDVGQIAKGALVGFVVGGTGAAGSWLAASGLGTVGIAAGTLGIGAGEGGLGQIGDNLLHGRAWHQDLEQATLFGAATAGLGGVAAVGARQVVKRFASKIVEDGPIAEPVRPPTAAEPGGAENRPVVIGENMERVRAASEAFGADIYGGFDNIDGLTGSDLETAQLSHNAEWMRARISEDRRVIDIGPWERNAQFPGVTPYDMRIAIRGAR